MFRKLAAVAAVVLAVLAATPDVSVAEPREPTCRGTACDGVSPTTVDCYHDAISLEGTRTTLYNFNPYASIVVRYSPTCQAAWTRLEGGHYYINISIHSYTSNPYQWRIGYSSYATPDVPYTKMVYVGYLYGSGLYTEGYAAGSYTPAFYSLG